MKRNRLNRFELGKCEIFLGSTLGVILFTRDAFAYLDPGTGSVVLQALLAAFFGSIFVVKKYWFKITGFFKARNQKEE